MIRNGLEPWHLLVVAIVIVVLFGSKKLPDAARGLGKSMRILKSEAEAMKKDGTERHTAGPAEGAVPDEPVRHVARTTPGEAPEARPHTEGGPAR
ncbi:Sec-independent protein translocase subunit TatA [Streptomyces sp. NBC_01754]|uniref:Sec-independent protein translocase subunit TatA n=1 Tax=Streptomyces sp. NBC_01754 TaxID=2975930 RepID=UPI002DD84110|nr:Sec-independent protein translocase subunit TatA [Streptomyces sp. NBC_01754]WSC93291.1 Sec-independent protein translocase subunit TatA [Streptomyces sp. NBC_01754]